MRAAVLESDAAVSVTETTDPRPGPRDLVLQVTGCGVCGSDVMSRPLMPAGTVMGHEFSGSVVDAGTEVRADWRDGEHVAVLPVFSCGACRACDRGDVAHCAQATLIGLGGAQGAFAELVRVPADLSFRLPDTVDPTVGPLVEPYAVGLHVARAAAIDIGDRVLVMGGGAVGSTTATWARVLGAARVVVSDPVSTRRDRVADLGIGDAVAPDDVASGGPYDVVIDCVGLPGLLDTACAVVENHGRVVVAGIHTEPSPFTQLVPMLKELTISFAVYYRPAEFQAVVDAFAHGRIDPAPLRTRTVGLAGLDGVLTDPHPDDLKIVIDPTR